LFSYNYPLKISKIAEDDRRLLTHWGCVSPNSFLAIKIRKLAKNVVYFGLYRQGLLGELHQTLPHDVSPEGRKNFSI